MFPRFFKYIILKAPITADNSARKSPTLTFPKLGLATIYEPVIIAIK